MPFLCHFIKTDDFGTFSEIWDPVMTLQRTSRRTEYRARVNNTGDGVQSTGTTVQGTGAQEQGSGAEVRSPWS